MMTDTEKALVNGLGAAADVFAKLPPLHPMEMGEFFDAIHRAQTLVMARVAVRLHPETFGTAPAPEDDPPPPPVQIWRPS